MIIGYARVSTDDQSLDLQTDALNATGCHCIFTDAISGIIDDRPGLAKAFSHLRSGDTLVVWRLDRLGRSLKHLIDTTVWLAGQDISFRSLTENIDTATSTGKLMLGIFGALAEFEKDLIHERTMAGLASARARGRIGGRKPTISAAKVRAVTSLADTEKWSIRDACKEVGISETSYYRLAKRQRGKING